MWKIQLSLTKKLILFVSGALILYFGIFFWFVGQVVDEIESSDFCNPGCFGCDYKVVSCLSEQFKIVQSLDTHKLFLDANGHYSNLFKIEKYQKRESLFYGYGKATYGVVSDLDGKNVRYSLQFFF